MNAERVTLIRSKNTAFAALHRAALLCYQKGKHGPLPTGWLARLAELRSAYKAAVVACLPDCERTRSGRPEHREAIR